MRIRELLGIVEFAVVAVIALAAHGLTSQSNAFGVTYENLRGTNYVFNSSHLVQNEFALLAFPGDGPTTTRVGTYSRKNVESELAAIAAAGFNNVRVTPSIFNWIIDNAQTERYLSHFVATCRANGLTITWVFWTAIGNGPAWQTHDVAEALGQDPKSTTDDALHDLMVFAMIEFHKQHLSWVPAHRLGYATGYPAPGNKLLRASGDPGKWTTGAMGQRVDRFMAAMLRILASADGRATLFQIDLGNELDTVGIPLLNAITFLGWNYRKIRAVLPNTQFTVGWAEIGAARYAGYVTALENAGITLHRHSFHYFAKHPNEYLAVVAPFVAWAQSRPKPLQLIVSEFYRVDTLELGNLDQSFLFFEDRRIPTIMWGYLGSNLFTDPAKRGGAVGVFIDGVLDATNVAGLQAFHKPLRFAPRSQKDADAVLDFNNVDGRVLSRCAK